MLWVVGSGQGFVWFHRGFGVPKVVVQGFGAGFAIALTPGMVSGVLVLGVKTKNPDCLHNQGFDKK